MHVEKGKYYRDGNGRVIGPLMFTGDGEFLHLVAEVYVSDTPPAEAPALEAKTLRDEFVMRLMDRDMFAVGFKDEAEQLYRVADAMMEARKK
jgi:hypothetical protein